MITFKNSKKNYGSHESCVLSAIDPNSEDEKDNNKKGVAATITSSCNEHCRQVDTNTVEELPHQRPVEPRGDQVIRQPSRQQGDNQHSKVGQGRHHGITSDVEVKDIVHVGG